MTIATPEALPRLLRSARGGLAVATLAALAALPLAGCVTRISGGDAAADAVTLAEAGPFPKDYKTIARRWFVENVRVMATIRDFDASRPIPGRAEQGILFGAGVVKGWQTTVVADGIDSIGMTTGHISYNLLIRDGQVVAQQKLLR